MTPTKARINHIRQTIEAMRNAWPFFMPEIEQMRADALEALIAKEDPEARGAIKALQRLIDLPETLKGELGQLERALEDLPDEAV